MSGGRARLALGRRGGASHSRSGALACGGRSGLPRPNRQRWSPGSTPSSPSPADEAGHGAKARAERDRRWRASAVRCTASRSALKDIFAVAGVRMTAGSKILAENVASEDAEATTRLRTAGAVIPGKLNLHEFAFGATGVNPHYGPARNPWDTERITGGSSSGSGAAVAAGECPAALGTDTGGSIRIPASLCGIVGLKPTYGRVSKRGVLPLSWSLDHIGPMTRTVEDAAIVLAGHRRLRPRGSVLAWTSRSRLRTLARGWRSRPAHRPAKPVLLRERRP